MLERLRVECGVSGSTITDVALVTGEHLRLKNWLISAWVDIQSEHQGQWSFLRTSTSESISSGTINPTLTDAATINLFKIDSFRVAEGTSGLRGDSTPMEYVPWDEYWSGIGVDTTTTGQPRYFSIKAGTKALYLSPKVDATGCKIYFDYFRTPVELSANGDTPAIASQYHMAPVYRAMLRYGRYEVAPEILQEAGREYRELKLKMELDYLPPVMFGDPLA